VGGRNPLLTLRRRERPQIAHPARRLKVVEHRFVAGDFLEAHHPQVPTPILLALQFA
jgi:hypothetical protein